jgi:hypothetical protein
MSNQCYGGLPGTAVFRETFGSGPYNGSTLGFPSKRLQSYFNAGTALDQIDGVSFNLVTIPASTPQTLDLTALVDLVGNPLTVARVRFLAIKVLTATDGIKVLVGNNGSNDFVGFVSAGGTITVYPSSPGNDGFAIFSAPNTTAAAVDATHKILKFDSGSSAATVLVIVGTASV